MKPSWRMLALALAATGGGCGSDGPELTPVKGTVTMDGKPLDRAELTFVPDPGNADVTAGSGVTDEDGQFQALYVGRYGLAPGTYRVMFRKEIVDPNAGDIPEEMLNDPEQLSLSGVTLQTLPESYSNINTTAFTIEVAKGGGPYDFDLDSKGR